MIPLPLAVLAAAAAPAAATPAPAVSPDGRLVASIRTEAGEGGASGAAPSSLWITDRRTGRTRLLFRGRTRADVARGTSSIDNPRFSHDGGYVYVEADAYATSPAIYQVDVRTGALRHVGDGALVGVLRDGPWRGFLLVDQHRYHPAGGSYDPVVVMRPDGHVMLTVPGSERDEDAAVGPWLRARGWHAS